MGTLLDLASLVTIPSGYKVGTVYSVVPTDGAGDLSFTRSNDTATRVGPNGLIEKVRTNVILQSNTFNTTWLATDATITSGATAPDGTATAWTLSNTAASGIIQQAATLTGLRSVSIYAKQGTHRYLYMGAYVGSGTQSYQVFDLQNGTIPSGSNGRIQSVGNGWYRCTSFGADGTTGGVQIFPSNNASGAGTTNGNILIWRCQYESGDIATDYIATTTTAVSVGPVANLPRLDYLNSTCPNLLLEPQRTNLLTNSEIFNNWQDAGGTVTRNTAISPSGYQDADTLTGARFQTSFASNQYTFSCYAKKVDGDNKFVLRLDVPGSAFAQFDLNTGVIDATTAGYSSTITNVGNGWYRCTMTSNSSISISNAVVISASGSTNSTYIWGAQLEVGANATSYIPTLGAASTRGADTASKTGISSLIGQTEGVVFWDINIDILSATANENLLNIDAGSFGNTIYLTKSQGGSIGGEVYVSSIGQCAFSYALPSVGRYKMALAYKTNDFAFYVNGVLRGTDSSGSVPATSRLQMGNGALGPSDGNVNQLILFPTRLSNAELAQLTTL